MIRVGLREVETGVPEGSDLTCPVCGGQAVHFEGVRTGDSVVTYVSCAGCGLLYSPDSEFFETVPYAEGYFENRDPGWKERAEAVSRLFVSCFGRGDRRKTQVIDIGAGNNYLVSLLVDAGFDAWGIDRHSVCRFRPGRFVRTRTQLPYRTFDVVTAVEVMEHFTRPLEEFESMLSFLKPKGALLFSTEVQAVRRRTAGPSYMNPLAGHATLWCEKALALLFPRYGFRSAKIKAGGNRHVWFRESRWWGGFRLQMRMARLRHFVWLCLRRRAHRSKGE